MDVVHCVFTLFGSMWVFGLTAIEQCYSSGFTIVVTVATFETAKHKPMFFVNFPTSTPSRARSIYIDGKRYDDPYGGEHE